MIPPTELLPVTESVPWSRALPTSTAALSMHPVKLPAAIIVTVIVLPDAPSGTTYVYNWNYYVDNVYMVLTDSTKDIDPNFPFLLGTPVGFGIPSNSGLGNYRGAYNSANQVLHASTLQAVFTALGGWLGWFLGGCDGLIYALIAFVVIDYITGVMCAVIDKRLSSEVGFRGIFKKVLIFMLVGVGNIVDKQLIGDGSILRTAVIFFYISNEGIIIIENAGNLGLPIPQKLKDILEQLKTKEDE